MGRDLYSIGGALFDQLIVDEMRGDSSGDTTGAGAARQRSSAAPTPIAPTSGGARPLPSGWEERRTPEGEIYYVDRKFRILAAS
jgi:WW domain